MPLIRVSDRFQQFIDDFCKKHKVKNREQASDGILDRLQYLEDLALDVAKGIDLITQKASGMDTELGLTSTPIQWMEQHKCEDRAIVHEKDGSFTVYCKGRKLPLEVCMTQQKKAIDKQWKRCYSPFSKPPTFKKWKDQEPRTRTYKGDSEGAYFPDSDSYYRDEFGQGI